MLKQLKYYSFLLIIPLLLMGNQLDAKRYVSHGIPLSGGHGYAYSYKYVGHRDADRYMNRNTPGYHPGPPKGLVPYPRYNSDYYYYDQTYYDQYYKTISY